MPEAAIAAKKQNVLTDYYPESTARFKADTANHEMTVLHDDGLYRHLRFKPAGRSFYWFDLITWPGKLAFCGDGDAFVFSRLEDMFQFFRQRHGSINPTYWSEKLVDGHDRAQAYSEEKFTARVSEELARAEETYPGVMAAWAEYIQDGYDVSYEVNAREALRDFEFKPDGAPEDLMPFRFEDTWEWDLQDWDWWFLWACQGIAWGIGQYDAARAATPTPAAAVSR